MASGPTPEYERLEEHMDVQAMAMRLAEIHRGLGDAHRLLSQRLEEQARKDWQARKQRRGR